LGTDVTDKAYFQRLAAYNAWANGQLYAAATALSDEQRRRETGLYFKSLHGTLKHLAATDNAWMSLLAGVSIEALPDEATAAFEALRQTRAGLDAKLAAMIDAMTAADFDRDFAYTPWAGDFKGLEYRQARRDVLAHLFNHHAHHRGQAHTGLSLLGVEPPPLDLFAMQITRR
jgi:uncharacterized damage-inducible protein DinB